MSDPFDYPAKDINTAVNVSLAAFAQFEPDLFLDGDAFMSYLNTTYDSFDVATYSLSKAVWSGSPLRKINRLIHGLRGIGVVRPKEHRLIINNHIKLFICYKLNVVKAVYIGSQNLTYGTNLNLMYRVRDEHIKPLCDFFELLWQNSVPTSRNLSSSITPPTIVTPSLSPLTTKSNNEPTDH